MMTRELRVRTPNRIGRRTNCLFNLISPPSPSIPALGLGPLFGDVLVIDQQGDSHADSRIWCCFTITGHQFSRKPRGGNQNTERAPAGKAAAPTPPQLTIPTSPSQSDPSALSCPRITAVAVQGHSGVFGCQENPGRHHIVCSRSAAELDMGFSGSEPEVLKGGNRRGGKRWVWV